MVALLLALLLGADPAAAAASQPDKDKLICRREAPIGSLIASRKTCLTKAQWEARARDGNEEARNQVYNNAGRPACTDVSTC